MQHPIYVKEGPSTLSEKADHLLALSRVGIAASDSSMNLDLEDCGYGGLFEVIALISADMSDELIETEVVNAAKGDSDYPYATAYLAGHAASLGQTPPATLIDEDDGAPSAALLRYCRKNHVSLDILFPSDPPKEPVK